MEKVLTVGDAKHVVMGPGGAIARSQSPRLAAPFFVKMEELGRQIATDAKVDFETGDAPDDMPLSEVSVALLKELKTIKEGILRKVRLSGNAR